MARKGLGKGLDSLIPKVYDENFDSNSPQSLEDILNDNAPVEEVPEVEEVSEEQESEPDKKEEDEVVEEVQEETSPEEETSEDGQTSEDISGTGDNEENVQTSQEVEIRQEHVDDVISIVEKNPRITLWSSRSSAVLRYLRKTEPEFSISKEASVLIEEAVSKKYPEIWALFEDL